jgi:hypothetical protein
VSIGYEDYARLSQQGAQLLYSGFNVTPAYDTSFFAGYVGSWPYITLRLSLSATADTVEVVLAYYSDSTFSTQVGVQLAVRNSGQLSVTQYSAITPWLAIFYITKSGNPIEFFQISVYATSAPANQFNLVSMDVPIYQSNASVAAGGGSLVIPQHVQPGPAVLVVSSAVTPWYCEILYYDYGSGTYLTLVHIDQTVVTSGGVFQVALIDTPIQVALHNGSAAAGFMRASLMSTL